MEERRLGVQMAVLPEGTTAKQALEMVYRGEIVLSPQQMRAAIECLQFEEPKVSAIAYGHFNGQSMAEALDRAIARSNSPHVMNKPPALAGPTTPTIIEHDAQELRGPFSRLERRF
jgi:hypothetical protein